MEHISVPRWSTYFFAARQDPDRALELYEWNLTASAATHTVLSVVEVALRNTIDRSLRAWNAKQAGCTWEWAATPCTLIEELTRHGDDLVKARRQAQRDVGTRRSPNHDDIVAHLMFGTWRYLLPTRPGDPKRSILFDQAFGNTAPRPAFPHWTFDPHVLGREVSELHQLRNRVSHNEPLLRINLAGRLETARRVLDAIDPALPDWLDDVDRLTAALSERP